MNEVDLFSRFVIMGMAVAVGWKMGSISNQLKIIRAEIAQLQLMLGVMKAKSKANISDKHNPTVYL